MITSTTKKTWHTPIANPVKKHDDENSNPNNAHHYTEPNQSFFKRLHVVCGVKWPNNY